MAGVLGTVLSAQDEPDEDIGPSLLQNPNSIPKAVKSYMKQKAYVRLASTDDAAWNGLFPGDPSRRQPYVYDL